MGQVPRDMGQATYRLLLGDALEQLRTLPAGSVHCVVTSPPYYALRDYGVDGQIGLEPTPSAYVERIAMIFREIKRVLREDGTVWLNLGDSYVGTGDKGSYRDPKYVEGRNGQATARNRKVDGLVPKNLMGIPWRVAFALQSDGWILRSDIIWAKENPMPESVKDRPSRSHEYVFLLTKSAQYYYDADAIREPHSRDWASETVGRPYMTADQGRNDGGKRQGHRQNPLGRNRRDVWIVNPIGYPEAHFATFPEALIEPMILAGCPAGGLV